MDRIYMIRDCILDTGFAMGYNSATFPTFLGGTHGLRTNPRFKIRPKKRVADRYAQRAVYNAAAGRSDTIERKCMVSAS